jgi:transcriptional regulator with XRE-family HTH domain
MYFAPAQLLLVSPNSIVAAPIPTSRCGQNQMMIAKKSPNPTDKYVGSRVRMRRLMLGMSQEKLGEKLGLTFQQVQKYEKGTNRIGASRLQHISQILKVPVAFFFEGVSGPGKLNEDGSSKAPVADYVSDFLSSSDGLALTKAFSNIKDSKLRRKVVDLVEEIAGDQR